MPAPPFASACVKRVFRYLQPISLVLGFAAGLAMSITATDYIYWLSAHNGGTETSDMGAYLVSTLLLWAAWFVCVASLWLRDTAWHWQRTLAVLHGLAVLAFVIVFLLLISFVIVDHGPQATCTAAAVVGSLSLLQAITALPGLVSHVEKAFSIDFEVNVRKQWGTSGEQRVGNQPNQDAARQCPEEPPPQEPTASLRVAVTVQQPAAPLGVWYTVGHPPPHVSETCADPCCPYHGPGAFVAHAPAPAQPLYESVASYPAPEQPKLHPAQPEECVAV